MMNYPSELHAIHHDLTELADQLAEGRPLALTESVRMLRDNAARAMAIHDHMQQTIRELAAKYPERFKNET